ncbi:hypothetical protein H8B06_05955 [Sphingobacterium sp. DN00404]|uniref:Cthe-2314-like HEPN domain-containing protein n=1 Tax=Sphingobacterium micropteri TaxID=2763501 RepID=A0ABR7YMA5_9SPHI|nr:hypothetical protein [Sphingobacterium micropteri]MBD1432361.1 hypothetical protein [Sphingobacterium micropteri]
MIHYKDDAYLFDELFGELFRAPNVHLVKKRLKNYSDAPAYHGVICFSDKDGSISTFIDVNKKEINKLSLSCSLSFYDSKGRHNENLLSNFSIDLYVVLRRPECVENHILMGFDELLVYLKIQRNAELQSSLNLPTLSACECTTQKFNYINEGRRIRKIYFPSYSGPVLDIYFENELNEVFVITRNALTFLKTHKERVFEELELLGNHDSGLNLYPRYNNCIAETAQGLYNFWERIAFIFTEFYPLNANAKNPPSYGKYFRDKGKSLDPSLKTHLFNWFFNRLDNEHSRLSTMRHPSIHYNSSNTPSGMRSVQLIKDFHKQLDIAELKEIWSNEIDFLNAELEVLSEALEKALLLIEEWAIIKKTKESQSN